MQMMVHDLSLHMHSYLYVFECGRPNTQDLTSLLFTFAWKIRVAAETAVQVKSWMDTLVGQDECITQLRRELGYMSLEMKLGEDSAFFDTRTAIKARIERQSKIHRKERLAHID